MNALQTLEYHTADKSTWGDGPWQSEPDKMQYPDPDTGLPCLIVRNPHGALCGYVGVSESNKWYGVEGYDLDLDVHGGITFTGACRPSDDESHGVCHVPDTPDDKVWWLGFDCSHAWDLSPVLQKKMTGLMGYDTNDPNDIYRTVAYVKAQIALLAKQVASV